MKIESKKTKRAKALQKRDRAIEKKTLLQLIEDNEQKALITTSIQKSLFIPIARLLILLNENKHYMKQNGCLFVIPAFKNILDVSLDICHVLGSEYFVHFKHNKSYGRIIQVHLQDSSTLVFKTIEKGYKGQTSPLHHSNDVIFIADDYWSKHGGDGNMSPRLKSQISVLVNHGVFNNEKGFVLAKLELCVRMLIEDSLIYRNTYDEEMTKQTLNRFLWFQGLKLI